MNIRIVFVVICLLHRLPATAQDFKTTEAQQARQEYLKALRAAEDAYIERLEGAAKSAANDNNLDEVVRIRDTIEDLKSQQKLDRGDPVVQLRRRLTNTTWSFNRPGKPETVRFLARNSVAKVAGPKMANGVWESLEDRLAITRFGENLFLFQFDENMTSFRVKAYGPVKTDYSVGKKLR